MSTAENLHPLGAGMGRPYATEITELYDTYLWSLAAPIDALADSIVESAGHPLIAIGSGGSLTSAHFACLLHTRFTGRSAQVLTPYELMGSAQALGDSSVLVCSAGGSNPDVLACVENAVDRAPHHLFAITTRAKSPLGRLLDERSWPSCHAFATPTKKDGFLATNSLLATLVLLTRAYETAFKADPFLPATLDDLLHPEIPRTEFLKQRSVAFSQLCQRDTLVVLHGAFTKPAAADLESRYTEAALGNVQVADFRNFAHGRHHWLAVHAESSAVVAFSSPEDCKIADRTLSLIPKQVPRQKITVSGGINGAIVAICESLLIANVAGAQKGIDPGRPHVPTFGRKLYHLRATPEPMTSANGLRSRAAYAIERKSGLSIGTLVMRGEIAEWASAYTGFVQRLHEASIKAIIFDYDGTLCGPRHRLQGPPDEIVEKLTGLLKAGVAIGVATGRGKSVREALRKRIRSTQLRQRIVIGYHNCAEIGTAADALCPPEHLPLDRSLAEFNEQLCASLLITQQSRLQAKGKQIAIELCPHADRTRLFEEVSRISRDVAEPSVAIVTSTHSIDILAPGVSKRSLLKHLEATLAISASESAVLCIGDRGQWPGNDWDLLSHPLSLSVDQVSRDPRSCWNLSDHAQRFDSACLEYLDMLTPGKRDTRFNVKRLRP